MRRRDFLKMIPGGAALAALLGVDRGAQAGDVVSPSRGEIAPAALSVDDSSVMSTWVARSAKRGQWLCCGSDGKIYPCSTKNVAGRYVIGVAVADSIPDGEHHLVDARLLPIPMSTFSWDVGRRTGDAETPIPETLWRGCGSAGMAHERAH